MSDVPIDYECIVQEVYEALLRPGDTAVDVGAHFGRHTFPMAECVAPRGHVVAVEPLASCREVLQNELRLQPELAECIAVMSPALNDRSGECEFVEAQDCLAFSGMRETPYPNTTRTRRFPAPMKTFDELFSKLAALHYVKLDAEGAEWHILRGARSCLERFRPVVGFEFGGYSNREFGVAPRDMAVFWRNAGFHVYAITGELLSIAEFTDRVANRDIWDYVAVPAEDSRRNAIVADTLRRPRINWTAVRAELNHAAHHADAGAKTPPLRRFRGPLRPLALLSAWLVLRIAGIFTASQRLCNHALLGAIRQLTDDLEKTERRNRLRDKRIRDLATQVKTLKRRLKRRRARSQNSA